MTTAIERIVARRREIQIEIERLTSLLPGLDNALEILKAAVPPPVAVDKSSNITLSPMEDRIHELHTQGMINKEIVAQLNREGMTCGDSIVSNKLRKLGLESHGKRLGGRRKAKPEPELEDEPASKEAEQVEGQRERLLCEVSDERLTELHAQGLSDKAIMITLQEEGFSAYQSGVSRRLRKLGLGPQRKTADDRKEEIAALIEEGKSLEEIAAATGLAESSVKLYFSILGMRPKAEAAEDVPHEPQADTQEEEDWDQGPFYRKLEEPVLAPAPKKRRGRPLKKSAPTEEGEYPIIARTPSGAPQFGSMRMKVIEEKVVDGHKIKVLPPGYAQGAYPQKNVSVRS